VSDEPERRSAELAALDRIRATGAPSRRKKKPAVAQWSGERDPQVLGDLIDEFIQKEGWSQEVSVGTLVARWSEIVGPQVAEHCHPETFDDGALTIRTDSSAWATQIRLLSPQLQTTLDQAVGRGVVTGITVKGPAGRRGPKGRWTVRR
jgi:predicted nucleic acid-binding Zn ribbon protein